MGAAASRCCESSPPVEVKVLDAPLGEYVAPLEKGGTNQVHSQAAVMFNPQDEDGLDSQRGKGDINIGLLQGPWLDKSKDNMPICNIQDNQICWHESGVSEFKFIAGGKLLVDIDDKPFTATLKPGSPPHLAWSDGCLWVRDELQGQWKKDGNELLGTVRDGHMYWDAKFEHPPSRLDPTPVLPFGIVTLTLGDEASKGIYDPGPPARLTWDDGEVWIRSAVF
mmetsp:Transcript_31527/g.71622  ORF Transcript_31527/g.71622 Transcript_31527/m.71622 type:complete len:223 (+) Transcript_31527:110-778(+)